MSWQMQAQHIEMESELDSVSYAVGLNVAGSLAQGGIDTLNIDMVIAGLMAVMNNEEALLDKATANKIVNDYVMGLREQKAAGVIKEGRDFLAANAKRNGVVTTASGLQYEVVVQGEGPVPTAASKVTTHYKGTLIDGTVFDSSYDRGNPATFDVTRVIKGWTEALQLMPQGSKWKLYIPYELAYGDRAAGPKIPPYSTLIFEIELLEVVTP